MGEILGPTGEPAPTQTPEDPPLDQITQDLGGMAEHFVKTMSSVGLSCVVVINGVLDKKLRRVYKTNITDKAERIHLFETIVTAERSTGIHMPAVHPLIKS